MKNLKYIIVLIFQVAIFQLAQGQTTDENGRPLGTNPGAVTETPESVINSIADQSTNSPYFSDRDVPSQKATEEDDTYYPLDLEIATEEMRASTTPVEMIQKINDLNAQVEDLLRMTEELRLENKVIRESLGNCCSSASLGLSANDAYLLQNAPNPFVENAQIKYFVPSGLSNVEIQISNIKGEVLSSIKVKEAGYGQIDIDSDDLSTGTFVYSLFVDGKIIDSKVMVKVK